MVFWCVMKPNAACQSSVECTGGKTSGKCVRPLIDQSEGIVLLIKSTFCVEGGGTFVLVDEKKDAFSLNKEREAAGGGTGAEEGIAPFCR